MLIERAIVRLMNRISRRPSPPAQAGLELGYERSGDHRRVIWPFARRAEHAACVGKTGSGKTHFMEWLACQLMDENEPFLFLDYHGDATTHLLRLATRSPRATDRVVLVDPTDPMSSPGLNPLERLGASEDVTFGRASELASILHARWRVEAFGPRTEELLRNTLYVLSATDQTIVEAPRFLTAFEFRQELLARIQNAEVLDYWHSRFEPLSEPMKAQYREALLNKITGFLTEPACRHLLGQVRSTVDLMAALDRGAWVIVNLSKGKLREHAHTLGNLIFARLQFDVLARANRLERDRRLFTVFADEVQNLAENDLVGLLAEGRKFGVSLITGHQFWDLLPRELRGALLSAGTHILFRVSSADAAVLAPELSVGDRQRYHRLLTELVRGEAIVRIGGDSARAIRVPRLPFLGTPEAAAALREHALRRDARLRSDIESEIRARRSQSPATTISLTPLSHDESEGQDSW